MPDVKGNLSHVGPRPAGDLDAVPSIEQHANWISACIGYMRERGVARIDLGFPAYVQKCDEVAANGYEGFTLTRGSDAPTS